MANATANYTNLTPYIPRTILNWYRTSETGETHSISKHRGAVVCIDASGFTALTRQLSSRGKEGPEILTGVLNLFFEEISKVIFAHRGDVLKFAGDALWAFFPQCPRMDGFFGDILEALGTVNSSDRLKDKSPLNVHVGAEVGEFYLASLGEPDVRLEAEPIGNLLGTVYRACDFAEDNQCAVGPALSAVVSRKDVRRPSDSEFTLVSPGKSRADRRTIAEPTPDDEPNDRLEIIRSYLPHDVLARLETAVSTMSSQGEHRRVVVLFANFENNVNRKTDDPVDAIRVMNQKITQGFSIIRQLKGSIARVDPFKRGHKLLVLFGAPTKRVDDEINALLCARKLIALADENFRIRVGLAIGPLFCGDVGAVQRREYTVMGDGVNLSARLMAQADWSEIIIDTSLRSKLPEEVRTESVTYSLKGIGDGVTCHRFVGVSEQIASQQTATSIIGRDSEQEFLASAWERTQGGCKQLLAVTGPAGIGKSTLVNNLTRQQQGNGLVYVEGKNSRLFSRGWLTRKLLQAMLEKAALEQRSDLDEYIRSSIETRWLPLLTDVLEGEAEENQWTKGLSPELRRAKTRELFGQLLKSMVPSPRLIVVDDYDQADELFRCLVASIAGADDRLPLLVVMIARDIDAWRDLGESTTGLDTLPVKPPTEAEWWQYFAQNFEDSVRERELFHRVLTASKGNPHFIMQFLMQCESAGKLTLNDVSHKWELASSGLEISIPDGLANLHMSIFDGLPEIQRTIMKAASVAVGEFSAKLISRGVSELDLPDIEKQLASLAESGLLYRCRGEDRYNFSHTSMRDAVYQCIPESQLRSLHKRYAEIIERKESDEHIGLLAYHYYRTGVFSKGFDYSLTAAQRAFKAYALAECADFFRQCLGVLEKADKKNLDPSRVISFYRSYSQFLVLEGRYGEAYPYLRDWRRLSKEVNQMHDNLIAAVETATLLWMQGRYNRSRRILNRVLSYTQDHPDDEATAKALAFMCQIDRRAGEFASAEEFGLKAVATAERLDDKDILADARNKLGLIFWGAGKLAQAAETFQTLIHSEKDNSRRLAIAQNNLALIEQERGHYRQSESLLLEALEIQRSIGDRRHEAYSYGNLGNLCRIFGKLTRAEELFLHADLIFERLDDRHAHYYTVGNLGEIDMIRGEMQVAGRRFSAAFEFAREVDDKELMAECEVRFGDVAFFAGRIDPAREKYETAIRISEEIGTAEYLIRASVGLARLLIGQRNHQKAMELIERITDLARENNAILVENEAVFLLGEHHRIKNEFDRAASCYTRALDYARSQNLFELILKSSVRLCETDPSSQPQVTKILHDLRDYFVENNSLPAWDQIVRSQYFSYFADTLRKMVGSPALSEVPTL